MSNTQQYFMEEMSFESEVRVGCISINQADRLQLSMANWGVTDGHVFLMLEGLCKKPGVLDSFVSLMMFSFPDGIEEFDEYVDSYISRRKKRAHRLPDGGLFDESVLSLSEPPVNWQHEAYVLTGRQKNDFLHIYRDPTSALMIRWVARTGTILDHPLFSPLTSNTRVIPGQWVTDPPVVIPRIETGASNLDRALSLEEEREIAEAVGRARTMLELGRTHKPEKVAQAIHGAIDKARAAKLKSKTAKTQMAIDLGALWGEALRVSTGWEWRSVSLSPDAATHALCSPNRSHAIAPIRLVFNLLAVPKSPNNSLLAFNMICSGDLPIAAPSSWCWLT